MSFLVTPSNGELAGDTTPQTTRAFVAYVGAQLGVNGSFFSSAGKRQLDVLGLSVSQGDAYSPFARGFTDAINFSPDNVATIVRGVGKASQKVSSKARSPGRPSEHPRPKGEGIAAPSPNPLPKGDGFKAPSPKTLAKKPGDKSQEGDSASSKFGFRSRTGCAAIQRARRQKSAGQRRQERGWRRSGHSSTDRGRH